MAWRDGYIAVDWGTTNRRAYLVDSAGACTREHEDELGLTSVPASGFPTAAAELRARLGDLPMLLAGMVGSNRGWREAPYIPCPAGLEALAEALLWIVPGRTAIVPGVCQKGSAGADVMRGEEVQLLGAVAAGLVAPDATVCHPGTHAKWAHLNGGRITAFRTMMTGELFALLGRHSILANQMQGEAEPGPAFEAGVDAALAGDDLLPGLFRIRAGHLLGEAPAGEGASYASGLLIGCDIRAGLALAGPGALTLMGRPELCTLYQAALARAGREAPVIDGAAAFLAGMQRLSELI